MRKNLVELKAKILGLEAIRRKLLEKGAKQVGVYRQLDTYYNVPKGRLKLRVVNGSSGQLVFYLREDVAQPKESKVYLATIDRPGELAAVLAEALGVKCVVDKVREIYNWRGVEVHLDKVRGLGEFLEFELEVSAENEEKGKKLLKDLLNELGIGSENLIPTSYCELVLKKSE